MYCRILYEITEHVYKVMHKPWKLNNLLKRYNPPPQKTNICLFEHLLNKCDTGLVNGWNGIYIQYLNDVVKSCGTKCFVFFTLVCKNKVKNTGEHDLF